MGVVQLNGNELRQTVIVRAVLRAVVAQDILQRGAGEDILLLDAQALALPGRVVRVEHAGDILGLVLLFQCLDIVLGVEGVEVQLLLCLALPQAERTDSRGLIADDRHVVGHAVDGLVGKVDLNGQLVAAMAPWVAVFGPVVGVLALAAAHKRLLEQAEAVAQTIAGQRQVERGGAVQEAGGETAKAAVAERCVLNMLQTGQIDALFSEGGLHFAQDAEVKEVAVDQTADQILRGEIERAAARRLTALGLGPVVADLHHDDLAQRLMQTLRRGLLQRLVVLEMQQRFGLLYDSFRKITHRITPSWAAAGQSVRRFHKRAPTLPARTGGRQNVHRYYTRFARAVKPAIFAASASLAAPGSIRQRQLEGRSLPGSFMRASLPRRR